MSNPGHTAQTRRIPSVTHYHAYLPPVNLKPLSDLSPADARVTFHSVNIPGSTPRKAESLLSQRHSEPSLGRAAAQEWQLSQTQRTSPPPPSARSDGPRRSKRLRTSASLLGTLPQPDLSGSLLSSLNTSASLSQSRPSASHVNLPRWTLPLNKLVTLPSLLGGTEKQRTTRRGATRYAHGNAPESSEPDGRRRVSLICCVMAVDAPVKRQRRTAARGRDRDPDLWIATWRVSAPQGRGESLSDPVSCDVKLWESCARDWGGRVRKGDVILLEGKSKERSYGEGSIQMVTILLQRPRVVTDGADVEFIPASPATREGTRLVLTPGTQHTPPAPTVLFRTLPRYSAIRGDYIYRAGPCGAVEPGERGDINVEDRALRPDLRLTRSDPGLRRVAELAQWCAEWLGGEGPEM